MNTAHSSILIAEVPGYAELQREMHDALRAQHPEWIEADGKSHKCDYYESRFAKLLVSTAFPELESAPRILSIFQLKGGSEDESLRRIAKSLGCAVAANPHDNDLKI